MSGARDDEGAGDRPAPVQIVAGGARLVLLPQRAVHVPEHDALLVADVHIGKAVSFRRLGVPVPRGTTGETLARLSAALDATGARWLVFLGDLLHSAHSCAAATRAAVDDWRARHPAVRMTLVRGNHDHHAGDPPPGWRIDCVEGPLFLGGLALAHEPRPVQGRYVLAGHLHPGVVLGGRAHDRLRLPCFHFGPAVGVLPAFGAFTGLHVMRCETGERVFVVGDGSVHALPGALAA